MEISEAMIERHTQGWTAARKRRFRLECLEKAVLSAAKAWHLSRMDQVGHKASYSESLYAAIESLIQFEQDHK